MHATVIENLLTELSNEIVVDSDGYVFFGGSLNLRVIGNVQDAQCAKDLGHEQ
jgi:hypothetical protein